MGRQLNFYMSKEDETEFVEFVRSTGTVEILPYVSESPDYKPLQVLPEEGEYRNTVLFFNRDVSSNLEVKLVPTLAHYTIDSERSSVIEFGRSVRREKSIGLGRIWAEFNYLDREKMILLPKEVKFSDWYNRIAKRLQQRYAHLERLIYAGPGAQKLEKEGFTLK